MSLNDALHWRYAAKRLNGDQVPEETLERIMEAARLAPSSFGLHPGRWCMSGVMSCVRACMRRPLLSRR